MMSEATDVWLAYVNAVKYNPCKPPTPVSIRALTSAGRSRAAALWTLRFYLRRITDAVPRLLQSAAEESTSRGAAERIAAAHAHLAAAQAAMHMLQQHAPACGDVIARFAPRMRAALLRREPPTLAPAVYAIFAAHLLADETPDHLQDAHDAAMRCALSAQLAELGFARVAEDALCWAVFERMDALVALRVAPSIRAVPDLLHWVHRFAAPCVAALLSDARPASEAARWLKRLEFRLHESVCAIRTAQLLVLIDQFPRSLPALRDLRDCIGSTDRKPFVAAALRDQFVAALLNPGVLTGDILQQYVNTIRTLRFLDPTGVILDCVSGPIRDYLRRRPDTVRCIVSGMTGDGDLYEELQRGPMRGKSSEDMRKHDGDGDVQMGDDGVVPDVKLGEVDDDDCQSIDGDFNSQMRVDVEEYIQWQPEAIDAPVREGKWRAGGDAIATLVAIYGTSDQIISEYRGLLADKVVNSFDVDLKREERILELLTERFGKEAMHDCSIILKDVRDSRDALEMAQREHGGKNGGLGNFEAMVISKEFWPKLVEEAEFKAVDEVEWQIEAFSNCFKKSKAPRKLQWQYGLGAVEVKLGFEDGREIVTMVTPMQATILWHFGKRRRLGVKDMMDMMAVDDEQMLRKRVQGLANQGLLRAVDARNGIYETVEDGAGVDRKVDEDQVADGDDGEDGDGLGGESEMTEMAVYETYVMAMLQNLKQLSLEQVHSMLQRFVQTPVYDKTQTQLAAFLTALVEKGKVEVGAGMYRVKQEGK